MSSFIIGKEEYIKAAGLVAGLSEALKLWVFDYSSNRNMNQDDYYNKFVECFEMNCLSFQEQYKESDCYTDSNDYTRTFKKYFGYGKSIGISRENLKETILELQSFFTGSMYQTEKESYFFKMQMFYNTILVQLMKYMLPGYESNSWGTLDIQTPKYTYSAL